ncbi:MAG: VOC family protein [Woeseiaceae bacterium]|nr:VOC family protein [Woeseiaceae bacterium]
MELKRVTTTILVNDVDGCAAFWTERLGFEQTMAAPAQQEGEEGNQFVALSSDRHELMLQSIKSTDAELPGMFALADKQSFMLFIEVSDLESAIERMAGLEPAVSRRTTFYGSDEIGYRDPCGTLAVLAEFPDAVDRESAEDDAQ